MYEIKGTIKGTIKEFDDSVITINVKATETYKNLQQRIDKTLDILENFDAWLEPQDTQKIRKCIEILKGDKE